MPRSSNVTNSPNNMGTWAVDAGTATNTPLHSDGVLQYVSKPPAASSMTPRLTHLLLFQAPDAR